MYALILHLFLLFIGGGLNAESNNVRRPSRFSGLLDLESKGTKFPSQGEKCHQKVRWVGEERLLFMWSYSALDSCYEWCLGGERDQKPGHHLHHLHHEYLLYSGPTYFTSEALAGVHRKSFDKNAL